MDQQELAVLCEKYNFSDKHIYRHVERDLILVTKKGIQVIIDKEKFTTNKIVHIIPSGGYAVVTSVLKKCDDGIVRRVDATGEATSQNCAFKFPLAVAENRSEARAVLQFIGIYHKGVIGEIELDLETEAIEIMAKRRSQESQATESLLESMGLKDTGASKTKGGKK